MGPGKARSTTGVAVRSVARFLPGQTNDTMQNDPKTDETPRSFYSYLILGAAIIAFIQAFSLLSPILFSFLLILLVSLAINPVISRMQALTGGRKSVTGLIVAALVVVIALTGWAFFGPMQDVGHQALGTDCPLTGNVSKSP